MHIYLKRRLTPCFDVENLKIYNIILKITLRLFIICVHHRCLVLRVRISFCSLWRYVPLRFYGFLTLRENFFLSFQVLDEATDLFLVLASKNLINLRKSDINEPRRLCGHQKNYNNAKERKYGIVFDYFYWYLL